MIRRSIKGAIKLSGFLIRLLKADVFFAISKDRVPHGSLIFFPLELNALNCGLASIIHYKRKLVPSCPDIEKIFDFYEKIKKSCLKDKKKDDSIGNWYLGSAETLDDLKKTSALLKTDSCFSFLFQSSDAREKIELLASLFYETVTSESGNLAGITGTLDQESADLVAYRIELLKDVCWTLKIEILENIERISRLMAFQGISPAPETVMIFRKINSVLNSIGTLEVRGRDSAGISVMLHFSSVTYREIEHRIQELSLNDRFRNRCNTNILLNNSIITGVAKNESGNLIHTLVFTYKIAAEIGRLGDNVAFIRTQIKNDPVFQVAACFRPELMSISSHTRWASVGAITEANCHPVDSQTPPGNSLPSHGIVHVCLNGDIDNYHELKTEFENQFGFIQPEITTDTKIIALQIERYLGRGFLIEEAFRLALNDFEGSHAITMQTDIAPGKLFLAQRGSGQAIFVGLSEDHAVAASEIYGFIEDASTFIKLDGDSSSNGEKGTATGQIVIIDQAAEAGIKSIRAFYYDGTPACFSDSKLKQTEITSRDIDRQNFEHFFLKEISESPVSAEKTLFGKWKTVKTSQGDEIFKVNLGEKTVPAKIADDFRNGHIKRIFFIGQGTAGVAGLTNAGILKYYLDSPDIQIAALKSSELSGSVFGDSDTNEYMKDSLVIAISQSGTTTDTNRSVDMARERGARIIAIVNRRDSDLTFKSDGVMYTSSGRDIEMSVASTKAFYSQIVAGALLGLYLAQISGKRNEAFVTSELRSLLALPDQMRKVLCIRPEIEASAKKHATGKIYWAAVGSGYNKAAADEIRIKLSELCYKTISSDYIEDKKHIDLSSEPLIIVCAAGSRQSVLGDIVKDVAIFSAHKAIPVVIADEGEYRFDNYATDVFRVPAIAGHLAPVLNTLAGHLWGYYAALSINEGSVFLARQREALQAVLDNCARQGLTIYEAVLDEKFRSQIARFYRQFREIKKSGRFNALYTSPLAMDIALLLKYLSGRLTVSDFESDFSVKGTASNMLNLLFECLGEAINDMARPVDAIKHQAKTVTVGTSRISEKVEGHVFEYIREFGFNITHIATRNIIVLKNLQEIISGIRGGILYSISELNILGEPNENTRICPVRKTGDVASEPSRTEKDSRLKGTKFIIAREGNVFIGKGLKDGRRILVIPLLSGSHDAPSSIGNLLSLNIEFRDTVSLHTKIKALGGKFERIRNLVQEKGFAWDNSMLDSLSMDELFGLPAEKSTDIITQRAAVA